MSADAICGIPALLAQIAATPGHARLLTLHGQDAPHADMASQILAAAERFSRERLVSFAAVADRAGCALVNGRVVLAPNHRALWDDFRRDGWVGMDLPPDRGGQGLPATLALCVQELLDRGSIAFGMVPGAARAAARVLLAHADPAIAESWVPKLARGEWAATICVSEPGAGSDVGRIRATAQRTGKGWRITGEKIWTSFGDHDLTERIGHLVLARPNGAGPGTRGLSLFLVPCGTDAGDRNGVVVRRIEEKLGLHASPTCALGFENSRACLIGAEGRGLAQLFDMIVAMRLQVGTQGLGIAGACLALADAYAGERAQGGPADQPPVPIGDHGDIQLMLGRIAARIVVMRGLVLAAGAADELCAREPDAKARARAARLRAWLLPIVKNGGAELAFDAASEAMLVFGGAGYTRDWPIERHLRDARVLAIYEGTTGMQALDLVRRRWLGEDGAHEAMARALEHEAARTVGQVRAALTTIMEVFRDATAWLRDPARTPREIESAARAGLDLASHVARAWIAARLLRKARHQALLMAAELALMEACEQASPSFARMRASPRLGEISAALRNMT